ncbi:hypothetical protein N9M64_02325, partial [bacterium]|nr:hypothetical protein [bacterium]
FQRPCAQLPPHDPHNDAWSLTVKYFPGGDRGSRWTLNGSVEWGYLYKKTSHRNSFTFQDPTKNHTHFTKLHKQPIVLRCEG